MSTMQFHGFHSMKRCRFAESDIYPQTSNKKPAPQSLNFVYLHNSCPVPIDYLPIPTYFKGIPHFLASHDVNRKTWKASPRYACFKRIMEKITKKSDV